MCGRYAAARDPEDLVAEFDIERVAVDEQLAPSYNVAPTDRVYAVLDRRNREQPSAPPQRQLRVVRWGLVPSWARDPGIGNRLINARAETLADKPAFRKAFAVRRCLLPADGYYEWYAVEEPAAAVGPAGGRAVRPRKQPMFIHRRDGGVLAMAGLYEFWRDPAAPDGDWLWSSVVITTRATDELGRIHDRMPTLVEPQNWSRWLDPELDDPALLQGLLVPAAPGRLEAYPVSSSVNDVRHDGPELLEPLDAGR